MKDIIIFDLDGTLFNTKPGIINCFNYALEYYGLPKEEPEDMNKVIGPPLHQSFERFFGFSPEEAVKAAAKYRERYKTDGIFECEPYDGIYEALDRLKAAGFILGVATSKPEEFALRIIDKFDMKKYFTAVTGSLLDNTRSKKSDVIEEELRRLNASDAIERCVMVGDREHDILGAKHFNMTSLGVRYGFAEEGELEKAGADIVVDTTAQMAEVLLTKTL